MKNWEDNGTEEIGLVTPAPGTQVWTQSVNELQWLDLSIGIQYLMCCNDFINSVCTVLVANMPTSNVTSVVFTSRQV